MLLSAAAAALVCIAAGPAEAAQTVRLSARFTPERLGAPTSMTVGFQITAAGGIPPPLTGVRIRYPANLGLATSDLGTAVCQPATLQLNGLSHCPRNSIMGSGEALARFRIGPEVFGERARLGIVAGPPQKGFLSLLVSATGLSPVAARIVMSSVLKSGSIDLSVPLVPSLPEGEDVSVVAVHATLGGNLTYIERSGGRTRTYRPRGITLPRRCPRRGFAFSAGFTFLDATEATAHTTVRCPAATH
jgi:hypothetical protein